MTADTLCKKVLGIKDIVVLSTAVLPDSDAVLHLRIKAKPAVWHQDECPHSGSLMGLSLQQLHQAI